MKVLSIKEPFASLIMSGKKRIETRSWKTLYRGELYIHASVSKIPKSWFENKEFMSLVDDIALHRGFIVCKCNLVDCIYMDEEFINKVKTETPQEYFCGVYEVGRYAWVLDDIEVLNEFIEVKGHLGIWNYNEDEVL